MPKVKLTAGAELDFVNSGEMGDALHAAGQSWFAEMGRGLKPMRMTPIIAPITAGAISAPVADDAHGYGPNPGFVWAIQRVTVFGLSTGDSVQIFRNAALGQNFIGQMTLAVPWFHIGSKGFILKDGDELVFTATGLTATGQLVINGEYVECPETMVWKLL